MRAKIAFCLFVAFMAASARARACDACESTPNLPRYSQWRGERPSFVMSTALGACWRHDLTVGGDGFCADILYAGVDVPFAPHGRFTAEFGFGSTPRATSGDPQVRAGLSSGGAHVAMRVLAGWDVTRLFFTRVGLDLRMTPTYDWVLPEPGLVAEMGTRSFGHVEIGFRGRCGYESVVTATANAERHWVSAPALGVLVFMRLFL